MKSEEWHQFFSKEYLQFSEVILTPERTVYEVEQIISILGLPPGAKILDLGCGQGRIAIPLAQKGYQVIGYDGAPELLKEAERRAQDLKADLRFIHGDMRELDFEEEFDAVLNLGTAFGYIEREEEDLDILQRVRKALKVGGYFLQDTENRELKLSNQLGHVWNEMNGLPVWSKREFNCLTGRWRETINWMGTEGLHKRVLDLRLYTATELIEMTRRAGLQVQEVYGGLDRSTLQLNSLRMVLLSTRV